MRRERLYLADIVEAADQISSFLGSCNRAQFQESELIRSAVLYKLTIIGEAASKATNAQKKYPDIPWWRVIAFRNVVVHDFGLYWSRVWETVITDVPILRDEVAAILAQEYS